MYELSAKNDRLKMTREKGQSDLTAFQVRIYTDPVEGVIPGMTIGVKLR